MVWSTLAASSARGDPIRLVLYDALASEAMGTFTTCVFLAGFAVELEDGEAIMAWEPELTPREPVPAVSAAEPGLAGNVARHVIA